MPVLSDHVVEAKQRLAEGNRRFERQHRDGCSGVEICEAITELRDEVLRGLFHAARDDVAAPGADSLGGQLALVAHGGYGRRDVAPYSDVDLMILHAPAARGRVVPLAERLMRDVFDTSLALGHSVRTLDQACQLACRDPAIATSLIESRLLAGSEEFFSSYVSTLRRSIRRQSQKLMADVVRQRRKERARYGETVYLLEPNIKRSRGALRDVQLLRWIGLVRYGRREPSELQSLGVLSEEDVDAIDRATEFLLRLRNELHFHAGKANDVLDRAEQLRIAERFEYRAAAGMLPIERLMRDYFRHTGRISHLATRFVANARSRQRLTRLVTAVFGHRLEQDLRVGPAGIVATERGKQQVRGNLAAVMRMADLSNLYNKPITPETWEAVRRDSVHLPKEPCDEACRHFRSLLGTPARLGALLRDLHETGVLERFVPAMSHARGLLQFNQYHKYTVDEHCLRSVESAARLLFDKGPLGREYRLIPRKDLLHLALLLHDLGKGFEADHCELGSKIATETAERLKLPERDGEILKFLVGNHLMMNHLAFRRDTGDEQLVVRFARDVGSPELLRMLFVLTAADLDAVGPGVWDGWKAEILTELYHRTMRHLAVEDSLDATPSEELADDERVLRGLDGRKVAAAGTYLPTTDTLKFTVGTREDVTEGVFYRLTGALTSCGLQIRRAEINTLEDGLVLDRFWVHDPDFAGEPPPERVEQICDATVRSLDDAEGKPPRFRRMLCPAGQDSATAGSASPRVSVDNTTSARHTILDVFAYDRTGLLYAITRALFELELSVWRAKIGTYLDQVVDVFYVSDRHGNKIEDESRLEQIRCRLLDVIEGRKQPEA